MTFRKIKKAFTYIIKYCAAIKRKVLTWKDIYYIFSKYIIYY